MPMTEEAGWLMDGCCSDACRSNPADVHMMVQDTIKKIQIITTH